MDISVISDQKAVKVEEVNVLQGDVFDQDLKILSEVLKYAWSSQAEVVFLEEAVRHILDEATRLYRMFYCDSIPLVSIDFKFKLARLSVALANMTLSTSEDLQQLIVTREHVEEVVSFLENEYIEAGLHAVAKSEVIENPTEEDLVELLQELKNLDIDNVKAINIMRFIVLKAHVTKNILKRKFSLTRDKQLRPLLAILQANSLLKVGRGFYPTTKLIQIVKLIDRFEGGIVSRPANSANQAADIRSFSAFGALRNDTPPNNTQESPKARANYRL